MSNYFNKYLKYKNKYLKIKQQLGGSMHPEADKSFNPNYKIINSVEELNALFKRETDNLAIGYIGIFINMENKKILTQKIPSKYENVYLDHITLKFAPNLNDIEYMLDSFGKELDINILEYQSNDKLAYKYFDSVEQIKKDSMGSIEAVRVSYTFKQGDNGNIFNPKLPHLTISANIPPFHSSALFDEDIKQNIEPFSISGKIGLLGYVNNDKTTPVLFFNKSVILALIVKMKKN
jgi:hypothetical protein